VALSFSLIFLSRLQKEYDKMLKKPDQEYVKEGAESVTPEDIQTADERAEEIRKQFSARGPLKRFVEDSKVLRALVRDWRAGKYRQALYGTIAAVVFGLLYVINPFDIIPDVLPVVGAVDDATVIGALLILVEQDLKKYRAWKERQVMVEDGER
jgi:uncharacterized membrane protein YkvA (DUF1232 family)